jgi:hypothetical protein
MREQSKLKSFFYPGMQYKYKWPIHQWYNADSPAKDRRCDETDTCATASTRKCSSSGAWARGQPACAQAERALPGRNDLT